MNPKPQVKKVVLAYSGGLDTSVIVPWLKENYGCEVVCFCADVGQGEEVEPARAKAAQAGVKEIYVKVTSRRAARALEAFHVTETRAT